MLQLLSSYLFLLVYSLYRGMFFYNKIIKNFPRSDHDVLGKKYFPKTSWFFIVIQRNIETVNITRKTQEVSL